MVARAVFDLTFRGWNWLRAPNHAVAGYRWRAFGLIVGAQYGRQRASAFAVGVRGRVERMVDVTSTSGYLFFSAGPYVIEFELAVLTGVQNPMWAQAFHNGVRARMAAPVVELEPDAVVNVPDGMLGGDFYDPE